MEGTIGGRVAPSNGTRGRLDLLISRVWSGCGKGAAFIALGFFETWLAYKLAWSVDATTLSAFGNVLWPINAAVFGGGGWKAWAKYKNGGARAASK